MENVDQKAKGVIILHFLFYSQMSLVLNFKASDKPFKASDSHNFFMNVLLLGYVLCAVPLCYVAYW